MKKTLTVFTPAYTRAHTIERTYQSLCRQTLQDFCWLIIDDGSKDNTGELVEKWKKENKIPITYIYQQNQGMHGAHNTAYKHIDTELNTCIDSDDFMPDNAVELIVKTWRKKGNDRYAGMIALDQIEDGTIIGKDFDRDLKETTLGDYYRKGGSGDKKLIYRTEVICKYPEYPIFNGEKYVSLAYKYSHVDQDYNMLVLNEPVCTVEYQTDGSSMNMYRQYWNNPNGFAFIRKHDMMLSKSFREKMRNCIHYVSSSLRIRNYSFLKETPLKLHTFLAVPFGTFLYLYTRHKVKSGQKMKI